MQFENKIVNYICEALVITGIKSFSETSGTKYMNYQNHFCSHLVRLFMLLDFKPWRDNNYQVRRT